MPTKPPIIVIARKPRPHRPSRAVAEPLPLPSRIVGAGRPQEPFVAAAEREQHQRSGDAADALFRELVRRPTGGK